MRHQARIREEGQHCRACHASADSCLSVEQDTTIAPSKVLPRQSDSLDQLVFTFIGSQHVEGILSLKGTLLMCLQHQDGTPLEDAHNQ